MPVEQFYTLEQTRSLLGGISEATLWRLRKAGKIGFVRVGNRPMFADSQIEAYQQRLMGKNDNVKEDGTGMVN